MTSPLGIAFIRDGSRVPTFFLVKQVHKTTGTSPQKLQGIPVLLNHSEVVVEGFKWNFNEVKSSETLSLI